MHADSETQTVENVQDFVGVGIVHLNCMYVCMFCCFFFLFLNATVKRASATLWHPRNLFPNLKPYEYTRLSGLNGIRTAH